MAVATERYDYMAARPPNRLAWSAIFGGVFVTIGVWILLYAFGLAIGLSAMDPENPASAKGAGLWVGWWSLIAPIIAMFCGGLVAAKSTGALQRLTGVLHGAVLWGVTVMVALLVFGSALLSALSGVFSLGGQALGAASRAVPGMAQQGQGLSAQAIIGPLNQRLAAEGKPQITEEQFNAATRDVMQSAIAQGRLDREQFISSLTANTQLTRQDAEELATRYEGQFQQGLAQARTGVFRAADITGAAMWGVTISMLLQLLAAILGASLGTGPRQPRVVGPEVEPQRGPPREVYP